MPRCRSLSHPYDRGLSRTLIVYIVTGIAFMILPGTLVGVLSLLRISSAAASSAASSGWVQAHGHAQIFGWLGTFILGIGYYAIPRLRSSRFSSTAAWASWALWTLGVAMRWAVGTWPFHWRVLFPLAGGLELIAVALFAASVFLARPLEREQRWRHSIVLITVAGMAMVVAVAVNFVESVVVARSADAPVFPSEFNGRYLAMVTWGFVVPFVWGFSSRWLPPLLGLRRARKSLMVPALAILMGGVIAALSGAALLAAGLFAAATTTFVVAMRLCEPSENEAKLKGVHAATPAFIRIAYIWSMLAAALACVAAVHGGTQGYGGASRHALTVGFLTSMVFTIGPRVLPAFFNVRRVWSTSLMAASLVLLNAGCILRVVSQVVAYEGLARWAWATLPASAIVEMIAVVAFGVNMLLTMTTGTASEEAPGAAQGRGPVGAVTPA